MGLPVRVQRGRIDPLELARNDFGSMISSLLGMRGTGDETDGGPLAGLANYGVDIREDADHIYVEADMPGFSKEDVDISLEDGVLTITAERREEITEPPPQGQQKTQPQQQQAGQQQGQQKQGKSSDQTSNYLLRERRIQRFVRSFSLPPNVDDQHVEAKLENGVLKITLNKREESKPRHVPIS